MRKLIWSSAALGAVAVAGGMYVTGVCPGDRWTAGPYVYHAVAAYGPLCELGYRLGAKVRAAAEEMLLLPTTHPTAEPCPTCRPNRPPAKGDEMTAEITAVAARTPPDAADQATSPGCACGHARKHAKRAAAAKSPKPMPGCDATGQPTETAPAAAEEQEAPAACPACPADGKAACPKSDAAAPAMDYHQAHPEGPYSGACPYCGKTPPADDDDEAGVEEQERTPPPHDGAIRKPDAPSETCPGSHCPGAGKDGEECPHHPEIDTMEFRPSDAKPGEFDYARSW